MTLAWLMAAAWLVQAPAARGQSPAAAALRVPEWVVVVAAPVYLPDGAVQTETMPLPVAGVGQVHLFSRKTLCAPAAVGPTEPADASFGWRVTSQIIARSDTEVVVSVDWRRLWDDGKKTRTGPGGTVQLTLHPGDRIPLDLIANASPSAACRAVGMALEVKLARTTPASPPPSASMLPIGATPGGAKAVNAELWLTHTSPGGTEQVLHQIVRLPEAGGRFSFPATGVTTRRGDLNVEFGGTIDRFRAPSAAEYIVLQMNRLVTGEGLPASGLSATTSVVVPMPGEGEVPSFELTGSGARGRSGAVAGGVRGGGSATAGGGARSANPGQVTGVGAAAGAGGGAVARGGGRGGAGLSDVAQLAALLEGHQFSLRLMIRPGG
jgi:hypothetical protein